MTRKTHHQHQLLYFGKEFSKISEYQLKPWHASYVEKIKKTMLDKNIHGKTLIDIGAGVGYVAIEMAKLGLDVVACDLTSEALNNIDRFRKEFNLSNIKLIRCTAEEIPIKSKSVDYVVACAILEHLLNEKKAVEEWKRILKPGGKLLLSVPLKYRYIWPFFIPLNYIHDRRIGHLRRYDMHRLKKLFKLKVLNVFYTGHFIKTMGFIFSTIFNTHILDMELENIDKKFQKWQYGALNIIVVFQN